ncbi:MAG TPA: alpha/beta hydrolase [Pirellulales bacterium]|nr:alpha/beta hydrolase [Pirellulales bacterium]
MKRRTCLLLFVCSLVPVATFAEETYTRQQDVIYGRKHGMAQTFDVFTPKENANRLGVIYVVSGGWFSDHNNINVKFYEKLLGRGYTVFAVVHGSQPRYTIPEAVADLNRAVRFIRAHASDYQVDGDQLGIAGASAGGHLSLMQGVAGGEGKKEDPDPVEHVSSRVQAVACFFPPTDFLNYGKPGEIALGNGVLKDFPAPFEFNVYNPEKKIFERINDEAKRQEIGRQISPITHVSADDPPTLIIHGDADKLVPIQQAQIFVDKMKQVGAEAKLATKPGAAHGWPNLLGDTQLLVDWFDEHLKKGESRK